jgi:hypothetical protein
MDAEIGLKKTDHAKQSLHTMQRYYLERNEQSAVLSVLSQICSGSKSDSDKSISTWSLFTLFIPIH